MSSFGLETHAANARPRRLPARGAGFVSAMTLLVALVLAPGLPAAAQGAPSGSPQRTGLDSLTLDVPGLERPVEILKDRWGIAHIYAETEHDLFFVQGWSAARDRLFQFEIWRRQATGTVAEILGERELDRDIGARLFRYRGDLDAELRHYHPRGPEIIGAFVDGVNAYVQAALDDPSLLSVEFDMLGIEPGFWTPEVVISRHQGLLSNINAELLYGRTVAAVGADALRELGSFGPGEPELSLDAAIDGEHLIEHDILHLYRAFRGGIDFQPEDVAPEYRRAGDGGAEAEARLDRAAEEAARFARVGAPDAAGVVGDPAAGTGLGPVDPADLGSNNWVVAGRRSASGFPLMANDPHRVQAAPSLRYWVHLVGPGWNVVGGGEPVLPGVSIGHNGHGAWGLTVFATDSEDLYVYELDPDDPDRYRFEGAWESMTRVVDTIPVRGREPEIVTHRYTRHGPVVYRDEEAGIGYAVRAAWREPGGAPYLASLRMDQATTWEEFREACTWSNIPGENMVWAGRDGTIGWQSVGIAPIRRTHSGLVPVPGDGRYEWDGYLPIADKPHLVNPPEGYFASANNDLIPHGYPHMDAVGFEWSPPYRWLRAVEVLGSGRRFTLRDMAELQTDELSIPARTLVPLLEPLRATDPAAEEARGRLVHWDFRMAKESVEAGIYRAWENALWAAVEELKIPPETRRWIDGVELPTAIGWLQSPDGDFGEDPVAGRDELLLEALGAAVAELSERFGPDPDGWVYGQEGYKHVRLRHPLSGAVNDDWRDRLEVGPLPRGGYGFTLNQTGGGDNQTSGASFRILVDTGDWDATLGMNNPGQGGYPGHPHYEDLFGLWAADRFHPVFYSREKVESVTGERVELRPGG